MDDYRAAGQQLAEELGENNVPLLEADVVWDLSRHQRIAASALAQFKQDRSLPIIVDRAHALGTIRGESVAVTVLNAWGEKGIEAARR